MTTGNDPFTSPGELSFNRLPFCFPSDTILYDMNDDCTLFAYTTPPSVSFETQYQVRIYRSKSTPHLMESIYFEYKPTCLRWISFKYYKKDNEEEDEEEEEEEESEMKSNALIVCFENGECYVYDVNAKVIYSQHISNECIVTMQYHYHSFQDCIVPSVIFVCETFLLIVHFKDLTATLPPLLRIQKKAKAKDSNKKRIMMMMMTTMTTMMMKMMMKMKMTMDFR
ncbi:hypothetical protein RFI_27916 [Reticulomyxa filosa]|uniref:Uncharacterized protein n=1 Tax=Reticulomyxa filosa TaxID=46433 RepID=X6M7N7_RETFI|nr:hypothetical protein RFI_27916 [Reticulomyxa filosa]|eukprot:ETO09462.1 hypothetical protein RFI_27916 [Reticulomyxa filosa]